MTDNSVNNSGSYAAALHKLGEALTELKRERGAPSYDRILMRGRKVCGERSAMSKPSMSEVFTGRRGPASLDRLLWLARALLSYDDGEEVMPPDRRDPQLQIWRERWHTLESERASSRRVTSAEEAKEASGYRRRPAAVPSGVQGQPAPGDGPPSPGEPQRPSAAPRYRGFAPSGAPFTGDTGQVTAVAFSPDGTYLAIVSGNVIRLWDQAEHLSVGVMTGNREMEFFPLAFSPDGILLAAGGSDGTVHLWEDNRGTAHTSLDFGTDMVYSVAFSPDGRLLAAGSEDGTVRLWALNHPATGAALTDQIIHLADLTGHTQDVYSVAFSPDGRLLATGSRDHTVRLWSVAGQTPAGDPLTGHTEEVVSVRFSPDGALLASGSGDGTVQLWDTVRRTPAGDPLTGHTEEVVSVAFSPDGGLLATGCGDGTVQLWDVAQRTPAGDPLTGHTEVVISVAFSPDGGLLATGSVDGTVQLWERPAGKAAGSAVNQRIAPLKHPLTDQAQVAAVLDELRSFVHERGEAGASAVDTMAFVGASTVLWLESLQDSGLPIRAVLDLVVGDGLIDETVLPGPIRVGRFETH
ncbi:WD40 repeat domain-containing protein [Streptomyces sp. NBC_01012]|uniref:WD40 repeat domain-containing protein n=1 Tax=Streptomyces sp. NBC_01012 TaxID=2903717 RepID=UPI002F90EE13|nr:WD40 repeat domain-containing protein [Streptomyces sp. NBC_01012]